MQKGYLYLGLTYSYVYVTKNCSAKRLKVFRCEWFKWFQFIGHMKHRFLLFNKISYRIITYKSCGYGSWTPPSIVVGLNRWLTWFLYPLQQILYSLPGSPIEGRGYVLCYIYTRVTSLEQMSLFFFFWKFVASWWSKSNFSEKPS